MSLVDELITRNERYAAGFGLREKRRSPSRKFAVVTCMDARLDPVRFLGLEEGEAYVIRNAGGLVDDDAIRSLLVCYHLLGAEEAVVIGHTDCGMLTFTNADLHERLGPESRSIDFQPFPDVEERVGRSVEAVRGHALFPDSFGTTGFVYDVETGRIDPV